MVYFLLNVYLGNTLVASAVLPVVVSPIIAVQGLIRSHAVPGAYLQSFQYGHVPEVCTKPPSLSTLPTTLKCTS